MFSNKNNSNNTKRLEELEDRLDDLQEMNTTLTEENNGYKKTISSFPGLKQEYEAELTQVKKQHTKEVEALKIQLKEMEVSLNKRLNESLQNIGVNTFVAEEIISSPSMNHSDIYQKFLSLNGKEQTEYYTRFQKEISQAVSSRSKQ